MGREAERDAIVVHAKTIWLPDYGPMAWPNSNFKVPNNSRWASFQIVELGSFRMSLSRDFFKRHMGQLQIDLYAPGGTGVRETKLITDKLEEIYEMLDLTTLDGEKVIFETPNSHDLSGAQERQDGSNGNWYHRIFEAPFYRDSHIIK